MKLRKLRKTKAKRYLRLSDTVFKAIYRRIGDLSKNIEHNNSIFRRLYDR